MTVPGITWKGESIDDVEILPDLPGDLRRVLIDTNGFILHEGALHVRGASLTPEWHSLREAWLGPNAFHRLYEAVKISDIPFAQDQMGDQFLIRDGVILRLSAETGEIEPLADGLDDFLAKVQNDIETFLTVGLGHRMEPGQLLHAFPPFCVRDAVSPSLRAMAATEVIRFHADLARQIRDVPDGGQIEFKVVD